MILKAIKMFTVCFMAAAFGRVCFGATVQPTRFHYALPTMHLKGGEVPMFGKWKSEKVSVVDSLEDKTIWINKVVSTLVDETTGKEDQNYFCHAHVGEMGLAGYDSRRFLGLHAGGNTMTLPEGFAIPMVVSKNKPFQIFGMAADYANRKKPAKLHFEFDIDYYDDDVAKKNGIKPLLFQFVHVSADTHLGGTLHELHERIPVDDKEADPPSAKLPDHIGMYPKKYNNIHWFVPKGKHEYRSSANEQINGLKDGDVRVFHIHLHLHPYAEYGELYDATDKKVLFRGKAETFPDRSVLKGIEHYSSSEGILLKKDHKYEVVTVYNNPKKEKIGAMLTMRVIYAQEK